MSRDDISKLLGGYATGTLTPDEQQALFEAALNDQELFDALAREQSLRDLLRDPAAKAQILAALDERPARWYRGWGWWRPAAAIVAMAGMAAVAVVVFRHPRSPQPVMVAQVNPPAEPPSEPKSAPASPVQVDRPAAPVKRKAQPALQRPAVPTVTATPEAPPATMAPGLRDAGRGGAGGGGGRVVGGAVGGVGGGVMGGVPGAAPQAAPPPPAPKVEVQATAGNFSVAPTANARALYYETPVLSQSFAPRQAQEPEKSEKRAAALAKTRLQAVVNDLQDRQAANLGVRYRILRQSNTNGDITTVVFTPNDNGMLSVSSAGRTLIFHPVARLATYTTEPLSPRDRELTVVFSRTAPVAVTGAVALGAQPGNILHRSEDADGTYVVGEPTSSEIRFTISLNPQ